MIGKARVGLDACGEVCDGLESWEPGSAASVGDCVPGSRVCGMMGVGMRTTGESCPAGTCELMV
jgi:hypothetical protein